MEPKNARDAPRMFPECVTDDEDDSATVSGDTDRGDLPSPRAPERRQRQAANAPGGRMSTSCAKDFGWEDSPVVPPAAPRRQTQRPAEFADAFDDGVGRDFVWRDD